MPEEEKENVIELLNDKKYGLVKTELEKLNEVDIAELFSDIDDENVIRLFRLLDKDVAADVFAFLDPEDQQRIIETMNDKEIREIMDDMFLDDTVDLVGEMPANIVSRLLRNSNPEIRGLINQFLKYPEDSAGSIMTIEYVDLKEDMTVEQAFEKIRKTAIDKETVYTCYVTDNSKKLVGVVSVHQLLASPLDVKVSDLMDVHEIVAYTTDSREEVALNFSKYGLVAMPVVDTGERLVGIVTVDDAMNVLEEETTEDIEKMAAIVPTDKPYLKSSVFEIWLRRIPWLLLLMVSATFTGKIIASFEAALAVFPTLTAFIPMIMDTGGNAGGQASVTVIRGLAIDEIKMGDILKIIWKELRVAILAGIALGVINFIKILLVDNMLLGAGVTTEVAIVICSTLAAAVIIAKLIGCSLPILAKRIGFDPAVMASPFITTIVDALSLLVYFRIATIALGL